MSSSSSSSSSSPPFVKLTATELQVLTDALTGLEGTESLHDLIAQYPLETQTRPHRATLLNAFFNFFFQLQTSMPLAVRQMWEVPTLPRPVVSHGHIYSPAAMEVNMKLLKPLEEKEKKE
jgi:hypothetical protein